jgi:menaquinone-dependent protoporphyrinogen IX oxidase
MKTLILYGTRRGATIKTCEVISEVLSDRFSHEVEVINVRNYKKVKKRVSGFNNIIIGSSIVSGRWVGKCHRILRSLKLKDQKLIVFVTAGGTMNKVNKYGITKAEAIQEGMEKYIDKYLAKYKIEAYSKMVFGGRVVKKDKIKYDSWNSDDIKNWAIEVGHKLA